MGRRASRFALRADLWHLTSLDRVRLCGRRRSRRDEAPQVKVRQDGARSVAHFARLMLCGRVWVCPVCGPRIRQERAAELDRSLASWIGAHGEGSVILTTYTLPHAPVERLGALLALVRDGFAGMTGGKAWQELRADFGIAGYVRAHDCTHGANGWHPHLHVVYLAERPIPADQVEELRARQFTLWHNVVTRLGHRAPDPRALSVEIARSRADVARYAMQVVSGDDDAQRAPVAVALEVTRGDLKTGSRTGQRTPWEVLAGATRSIADADGVLDENAEQQRTRDRALWREWEQSTQRVHAVQWSRGLRARIGLGAEQSDEEVVAVEVGGEVVYEFTDRMAWLAVCDVRGGQSRVLRAAERWGAAGCARMVAALRRRWQRERERLGCYASPTLHAVRSPIPEASEADTLTHTAGATHDGPHVPQDAPQSTTPRPLGTPDPRPGDPGDCARSVRRCASPSAGPEPRGATGVRRGVPRGAAGDSAGSRRRSPVRPAALHVPQLLALDLTT